MSGTPLTKPLHNGRVQIGTGVSCMGCKLGSTGFTALRSSPWPLGLAVGVGTLFAICTSAPWLLSQKGSSLIQDLNQRVSAALVPITLVVLDICWLAALARFVNSHQCRKLMHTLTTLESSVADARRHFGLLVCKASRLQDNVSEELA